MVFVWFFLISANDSVNFSQFTVELCFGLSICNLVIKSYTFKISCGATFISVW